MNHLTDDQIQAYLDKNKLENLNDIEDHLQVCQKCRFNINTYRQIYTALSNEDELPVLSNNFSFTTISKIEKANERKWNIFENILIALTFIVSISLSIYFFDLVSFASYFREIDFSLFTGLGEKVFSTLSPNVFYITAAILITGIIELLDRFRIQKSAKHFNH